eukprot:m.98872 g.98872  ORF g.98872 m.98872 type:complete len:119 (+) comp18581_c0_seq8:388-744(+)
MPGRSKRDAVVARLMEAFSLGTKQQDTRAVWDQTQLRLRLEALEELVFEQRTQKLKLTPEYRLCARQLCAALRTQPKLRNMTLPWRQLLQARDQPVDLNISELPPWDWTAVEACLQKY